MPQPEFAELSTNMIVGPQGPPRIRSADPEEFEELPEFEELLARLGELSELLGAERCATSYQLYAPEDLPENFADELELVDVRALLRRLLRYAGEDDESLPVELADGRAAEASDFADHLAGSLSYAGLLGEDEHPRLSFVVFDLGDLRAMMGPSCVELGRALVHRAQLEAAGAGYREQQRGAGAELPSELDGFLACFALGWGLPVTNACLDPRSAGEMRGNWSATAWVSSSLNFPPDLAARLLAVTYRAGARDEPFLESRRETLNPSQLEIFEAAFAELEGEEEQLRELLRWRDPADWPAPRERALDELSFDAHDEALVAAQELHHARILEPNTGLPVFRARPKRTWLGMFIGGVVGLFFGSIFGVPGMVASAALGALAGSSVRGSICSAPRCGANLKRDAEVCSKCGGTVVGEIERAKDHLAALEDYEAQAELEAPA